MAEFLCDEGKTKNYIFSFEIENLLYIIKL